MARDISKRLDQLRARRIGLDRLGRLSTDSQTEILNESASLESYQRRAQQPYTRYALGGMQEVGSKSTRISIEEAERVGKQLLTALDAKSVAVSFELQGSVPCNIHIRGVSDVDLLVLDGRFRTYDTQGPRSRFYTPSQTIKPLELLQELRGHAESILKEKFPGADVDTSRSKAINISGASLRRPVDVVPSHWHDTHDYQTSAEKHDRGVYILDKKAPDRLLNMPFRHIKRIGDHDLTSIQTLKKAIRLCKNVKNDANEEGADINLSSFDIASAMWHADLHALSLGVRNELAILAETQRHLEKLKRNHAFAKTLSVPDGSRKIFDNDAKLRALNQLSSEIDDLAFEVSKEQSQVLRNAQPTWMQINEALEKAYIPFT